MKSIVLPPIPMSAASSLIASPVTYQFTGRTSSAMNVNNGSSTGSIAGGTPFPGTRLFDNAQTEMPVALSGGTHSTDAFTSSKLPSNLRVGNFQNPFVELNSGALGTPWGAGNTSMLQFLTTLSKTLGSPVPAPTITTSSLPKDVIAVTYSVPVKVSVPNDDATTVTVAALHAAFPT